MHVILGDTAHLLLCCDQMSDRAGVALIRFPCSITFSTFRFQQVSKKDRASNLIYLGSALRTAHPRKMSDSGWPVVFVLRVWPRGGELMQEIDS